MRWGRFAYLILVALRASARPAVRAKGLAGFEVECHDSWPMAQEDLSIPRQLPAAPKILRDGSNTRSTWRFNALMTPIRANIVGPPNSATSIRPSIAACHSGVNSKRLRHIRF